MNILFLAYNINIHSRTGDAIHVRELVLNLAALGNKVSLVLGFNPISQDLGDFTNNPNLDIHYIKEPRIKFPRSRDLSIILKCFYLAKKTPFDIIYERNFSCRMGVILSKLFRIPLVVEINGIVDEEAEIQGRHSSSIKKILGKRLRRAFFQNSNKIVAVTASLKNELMRSYRIASEKIIVVPNGANTDIFQPMEKKKVQEELGLAKELKYICFVGNLAPWQGVEYLVLAAPKILLSISNSRFLIVGDGIMKSKLISLAREIGVYDIFIFTGVVPYEKVPLYINASELGVAPSARDERNEKTGGSSMKIYEYLACEKPVVTGNLDGDNDLVLDSKSGYVVSAEKTPELENAIINLLNDKNLSEKMGKNGRKYVVEKCSWKSIAKTVLKIMDSEVG